MSPKGGKRARAGRPAMNGPHTTLSAWVPVDLKSDVKAEAQRLGTTVSAVVIRRLTENT